MHTLFKSVVLVGMGSFALTTEAADCTNLNNWTAQTVYNTGDTIQSDSKAYQANYWTQGNLPANHSGQWAHWTDLGSCSTGGGDTGGGDTGGGDTGGGDTGGGDTGNCSGVAYSAGTAYSSGQSVSNNAEEFTCNVAGWCSSSAAWAYEPGVGAHWQDAWSKVGSCGTGGGDTGGGDNNVSPTANANGTYSGLAGASIIFSSAGSDDSDGTISTYAWNFGDGSTSSLENPSHAYANAGTYTVSLTVTDNDGAIGSSTTTASITDDNTPPPVTGDKKVIGYFAEWGVYGRNYHVKDLVTSGSAPRLTHIVYAFGNVQNGQCVMGDSFASTDKFYSAADSIDGTPDTWDTGALRGSFNQLRKLKALYPNIKIVWSFGGWTWSGGFGQASQNATSFAESCYNLVNDPRWADVFDGIDIDWEYPNSCGLSCDSSGPAAYTTLMQALRARFGNQLVTAAIGAGSAKLNAADYGPAAQYLDFYMLMTYDFFGGWDATGPTAPHSALDSYAGIPADRADFYSSNAVTLLKSFGVPANKILLGIGFYGRGWTGVTQSTAGGSASAAAAGTYETGIEDYKVLKTSCPATGTIAGTAYAHCGNNWWSYDTPSTIQGKMNYAKQQGLGGAFFWEFSGDTSNGELIKAISDNLQ